MPRLLIVIDEFAALVAELPDFVTGLVDIARRGRSLGVHLILATQRPAGVVSAEIKSNTNLRIALRVTDAGDSADVLEAPDAAQIAKSTPGRGYARLGHSSLIPFQSSRVGGRPRGEEAGAAIDIRAIAFAELGTPRAQTAQAEEDISVPTDLAAFVTAAREASSVSGIVAPPSPWLPAMSEQLTLDEVVADFPASVPTLERLVLPFGMVDVPVRAAPGRRVVRRLARWSPGHRRGPPGRSLHGAARRRGGDRPLRQPRRRARLRRRLRQQRVAAAGGDAARRCRRCPRPGRPDGPADCPAARRDRAAAAAAGRRRFRRRGRAAGARRTGRADAVHRRAVRPLGGLLPGVRRPRRRAPRSRPGSRSCRRAPASASRSS